MGEFKVSSNSKYELIDITNKVKRHINIENGLCNIYVPHATAAIIINENYDPNICEDLIESLQKMIPDGVWRHDRIDGNGGSHLKAAILGPSETIPIINGKLLLGTWQSIMLAELDGPRENRKVYVNIIKG